MSQRVGVGWGSLWSWMDFYLGIPIYHSGMWSIPSSLHDKDKNHNSTWKKWVGTPALTGILHQISNSDFPGTPALNWVSIEAPQVICTSPNPFPSETLHLFYNLAVCHSFEGGGGKGQYLSPRPQSKLSGEDACQVRGSPTLKMEITEWHSLLCWGAFHASWGEQNKTEFLVMVF